jgi:hypothetical protein
MSRLSSQFLNLAAIFLLGFAYAEFMILDFCCMRIA